MESCGHLEQADLQTKGKTQGCEECEKIGSDWVHLRLCLSCGHVGCCDASPNKHGTKHFKSTNHPVIKSYEPDDNGPFEIVEKNIPEPNGTQVRIKVQACGICHSDSFTKEGPFPGIQISKGSWS